jgi:hypothetical protein
MITLATYDTTSGKLGQLLTVPDAAAALQVAPAGSAFLTVPLPDSRQGFIAANYVLAGAVVPRQTMTPSVSATTIASDGVAASTISSLPDPCSVTIGGIVAAGPDTVTGGSIIITSDHPGDITITVSAAPAWLDWTGIVHAV